MAMAALAGTVASPIAAVALEKALKGALSPVFTAAASSQEGKSQDQFLDVDPVGAIFALAMAGALDDDTVKMARRWGYFEAFTNSDAAQATLGKTVAAFVDMLPKAVGNVPHAYYRMSHTDTRKNLDFYLRAVPQVQIMFPLGESQVRTAKIKKLWKFVEQGLAVLGKAYQAEKINKLLSPLEESVSEFLTPSGVVVPLISPVVHDGYVAPAAKSGASAAAGSGGAAPGNGLEADALSPTVPPAADQKDRSKSKKNANGKSHPPAAPSEGDAKADDVKTTLYGNGLHKVAVAAAAESEDQIYQKALRDFQATIMKLPNKDGTINGLGTMKQIVQSTIEIGRPPLMMVRVSDIVKSIWTDAEIDVALGYLDSIKAAKTNTDATVQVEKQSAANKLKAQLVTNGQKYAKNVSEHLIAWQLT